MLSLVYTVLAMFSIAGHAQEPEGEASILSSRPLQAFSGRPAANLTIQDVNGKAIPVSEFKGKVVLINMWATWCPPCVRELPALQQLYYEHEHEGLIVIALAQDADGWKKITPFFEEYRIKLPVYLDEAQTLYRALEVRGLPTTFVMNRKGEFVAKIEGFTDWLHPDKTVYIKALLDQ